MGLINAWWVRLAVCALSLFARSTAQDSSPRIAGVVVETVAEQGGNQIVRNATAELRIE